jgi:hypothetical protein
LLLNSGTCPRDQAPAGWPGGMASAQNVRSSGFAPGEETRRAKADIQNGKEAGGVIHHEMGNGIGGFEGPAAPRAETNGIPMHMWFGNVGSAM